jgi:hypothetical protein
MGRPFLLAWGLLKSFNSGYVYKGQYDKFFGGKPSMTDEEADEYHRLGPPLHELSQYPPKHQEEMMDKVRELQRTGAGASATGETEAPARRQVDDVRFTGPITSGEEPEDAWMGDESPEHFERMKQQGQPPEGELPPPPPRRPMRQSTLGEFA